MDPVPTDERGNPLELGYYSIQGQLFDRGEPTPSDLLYMMNSDSQVGMMIQAISLPLQRAELTIEAADNDKGEADFVRSIIFEPKEAGGMETNVHDVVKQMVSAVFLKRAYFEKVWDRRPDNRAVYKRIAYRPVTNCTTLVKDASLNGFKQLGTKDDGTPFDEDFFVGNHKAFVYFYGDELTPLIGSTLLQTAFGDFVDKLRVNRLWNIHLQNYALGTWVGRYLGNIKGAAKALRNKLRRFKGGGGTLVLENNEEAEIQNRTGAGGEFQQKAQYLDQQMAGSMMLRWQMLGTASNTGSWALSRDHSDFFLMLLEAILEDVAQKFTDGIIADLVEVNFGKDAAFPTAKFDPLAEGELDAARDSYMQLSTSAYRPTGPLWQALEERFARSVGIPQEVVEEQHKLDEQTAGTPPSLDPRQTPQGLISHVQRLISNSNNQNQQQNTNGQPPTVGVNGNTNGNGQTPPST